MILLVLWLLLHAPSTTFFSERPHLVSLAVDREIASRVDSYVLDLLPPEDHANSTRSGYDVSGFLDPVKVIHTVGAFVAVITIAWLALHFILVGVFYAYVYSIALAVVLLVLLMIITLEVTDTLLLYTIIMTVFANAPTNTRLLIMSLLGLWSKLAPPL